MLKIKKLDHVAVAVADLDAAVQKYREALGIEPGLREYVEGQKTDVVLLPGGGADVELIAPHGNAGLEKFLEKRGPGLHHLAFEVEGLEAALVSLKALGVPLIDEQPRVGARGHRVAFLHPRATGGVLIELVEPMEPAGGGSAGDDPPGSSHS